MAYTPLTSSGHSDFPIQSLWIGSLGALERLSMRSFLAHGHRYHLYAYDLTLAPPPGVELKDAREILPEEAIFTYPRGKEKGGISAFADWFRYELLAQKGGWWCDTDIICLKPFLFENPLVLASERHWLWKKRLSVAVMRAPAGHPLFQA
ncbi:MAG: capsular polysaccharide synthesis protein, partial [Rickettsiales bacterium]|nr:capsular polysaccharide synthesis protein [Rickettsiales bacterium]